MIDRPSDLKLPIFILLATVFTVALTFATVEAPVVLNHILADYLNIPDYNPAIDSQIMDGFMTSYHLRPIGYAFLAILVVLIIAGFVTKRTRLSALGTIPFFLPTFGSLRSLHINNITTKVLKRRKNRP